MFFRKEFLSLFFFLRMEGVSCKEGQGRCFSVIKGRVVKEGRASLFAEREG